MKKGIYYSLIFAVAALGTYAIRSYAYQKEVSAYILGCKTLMEAEAKKREEEENDRLNK